VTGPRVTFVDDEPNGLAVMVGGLIEANLSDHPRRAGLLHPAVVDLIALDADVAVSLGIDRHEVRVANGTADGRAHIRVTTDSMSLVELAGAPLRLGLPDVFHPEGRRVARKVLDKRLQVDGLLRHLLTLSRVTRLLSVA